MDAPDRPEAYLVLGLALAQQNEIEASIKQLEAARKRGSSDRQLYAVLASVYDVARRYDDAVAVYRDFLAKTPGDAEMRHELGLTLLAMQKFEEAIPELEKVTRASPKSLQAHQDLGYALLIGGRAREAVPLFEQILKATPNNHDALIFLVRAQAGSGNSNEAIVLLDELLKKDPADPQALRMRARLFLLTGRAKDAAADYERLLEKANPADAAVWLGYAGVLIALDDLDKADNALNQVRQAVTEHPLLAFRSAQVSWRRGKRAAVSTIANFARGNPTDVEAWRDAHAAAMRFNDRKLAKEAANKLRALGDM